MQHLILKTDLDQGKINALIAFLKSWNVEAEVKNVNVEKKNKPFLLSTGLWENYEIDAKSLRSKAWSREK